MKRDNVAAAEREAQTICAGQRHADAKTLLRLISLVNPTDQALPGHEATRQYRLKSQLQSRLIANFFDELEIRPEPELKDTVGIWHRYHGASGCHALISALDDEAQSLVRRRLDEEEWALRKTPRPKAETPNLVHDRYNDDRSGDGDPSEDVLLQGRLALEQFDYDEAERLFVLSVAATGGAPESVASLLGFYVEHMAAFARAWELRESLTSAARKHPEVRRYLALAGANLGHEQATVELLAALDGADRGEPLLVLSERALARNRPSEAEKWLKELERVGLPEQKTKALAITAQLPQAFERAYGDHARRILELHAAGRSDEAYAAAKALLEVWPYCEAARRTMSEVEKSRRECELEASVALAGKARAAGSAEDELEQLRRARLLGSDDVVVEERIKELVRVLERKRTDAGVAQVTAPLDGGDLRVALLRYVTADQQVRAAVRAVRPQDSFHWAEKALAATPAKDASAVALAVLALCEADTGMKTGRDPGRALDDLRRCQKILRHVPWAEVVMTQLVRKVEEGERKVAADRLSEAQRAIQDGQLGAAARIADQIDEDRLEAESLEALRALRARLENQKVEQQAEEQYREHIESRDYIAAGALAMSVATRDQKPDDASIWRSRADDASKTVAKEWRLVSVTNTEAVTFFARDRNLEGMADGCPEWNRNRGELLIVNAQGRWVFISALDNRGGSVTVTFRTPCALSYPKISWGNDEQVWVTTESGFVLRLSRSSWRVEHWFDARTHLPAEAIIDELWTFAPQRLLWLSFRELGANHSDETAVLDLDRGAVRRRIRMRGLPQSFFSRGEGYMASLDFDKALVNVFDARGGLKRTASLQVGLRASAVCEHPTAEALLILAVKPSPDDPMENEAGFVLLKETPGVGCQQIFEIEDAEPDSDRELLVSRTEGLVFLYFTDLDGDRHILALEEEANAAKVVYDVISPRLSLHFDRDSSDAICSYAARGCLQVMRLGRTPPVFELAAPERLKALPEFRPLVMHCGKLEQSDDPDVTAYVAQMQENPSGLRSFLARERERVTDSKALMAIFDALQIMDFRGIGYAAWSKISEEFRDWIYARFPRDPRVALGRADALARDGKWTDVEDSLRAIPVEALDDIAAQHVCHLRGIALYRAGQFEAARETWECGEARQGGTCDLRTFLDLVNFQGRGADQDPSSVTSYLIALEAADLLIAAGDTVGARESLTALVDRYTVELQTLARLAFVHLEGSGAQDEFDVVRKRFDLARFLHVYDERESRFHERQLLPPSLETWSEQKLAETAARANEWLEEPR